MNITENTTVGEVARNLNSAARFFEKVGIDYCCGGDSALAAACQKANVDINTVIATLETIQESGPASTDEREWNSLPLTELVAHIVERHHTVVQTEIPRLVELITKMCQAHRENRPEFLKVRDLVVSLQSELYSHLRKEEEILFPYVEQLENQSSQGEPAPSSCFGTVQNPINVMEHEHENAGQVLGKIGALLTDRTGCPTCLEFFRTFDDFEKDLHQHIHLENNILFPRTIELEAAKKL